MAIYDLGTASLSANGEVTGVGTTWKAPLTLIRVGATIVFKTEPVKIYTISEIISDTRINVYNPNSETVPDGTGYAILAHDGITVQGLAQDVAETLRYYQSRETEVADAVDAFNNFDANDFNSKVTQVNTQHGDVVSIGTQVSSDAAKVTTDKNAAAASAASASADKNAAAASAASASADKNAAAASAIAAAGSTTNAKTSETNAKASENSANGSKNAAAASAIAAAGSATNAKTSETNAKASENSANGSKNAAAASATNAKTSETNAKTSENNAKSYADSINPSSLLAKNQNLNDVESKSNARLNLSAFYENRIPIGSSVNLNTMGGESSGIYRNSSNLQATVEKNYPIRQAGTLMITKTIGNEQSLQAVQKYHTYQSNRDFSRVRDETGWNEWREYTMTAVSDERLKDIKGNLDVEAALDNINRIEFKIFSFNNDGPEKSARRGVISQQLRLIDKEYTKEIGGYYHLDQTPMLLDGLASIKALRERDEGNKERIAKLESDIEELKAMVLALSSK